MIDDNISENFDDSKNIEPIDIEKEIVDQKDSKKKNKDT